ncbi:MAG: calcium/proton exchanger, partial [Gemmatimonadales bacterium]
TWDDVILVLLREPRGAIARAVQDAKVPLRRVRDLLVAPAARRAPPMSSPKPESRRARAATRDEDDIPDARPPERPRLTPPPRPEPPDRRRRWLGLLYLGVPVSGALMLLHAGPLPTFVVAVCAIPPLAGLIATATEHLAERTGATVGAMLNAAFGNATEIIVCIAALSAGYIELVKASIAGSVLSNLLLILGVALISGGLRRPVLRFDRTAAGMGLGMLALAVAALILPTFLRGTPGEHHLVGLSETVAVILALTYVAWLVYVASSRRGVVPAPEPAAAGRARWPLPKVLGALAVATVLVAFESDLLVKSIGPVTRDLGVSEVFLGLIVVPIVGNAAEHVTAVIAAYHGRTDLAVQVAVGSSTQIALVVAPLLVFAGALLGAPMTLVFPELEVLALAMAVIVTALIVVDGESHWLEGVQLVALYGMIAAAAWFI